MHRILFVCLGNICRSPAAEAVFKHLIKQEGIEDQFVIDSAGTGDWHVGELADKRMRAAAEKRGIEMTSRARQIRKEDFKEFDLIIAMDDSNVANIKKIIVDQDDINKIKKMTDYQSDKSVTNVPDPYFGGEEGFEYVLDLVNEASKGLINDLSN